MKTKPVAILGGVGFIGVNLAHRLLAAGERVRAFDNLSRPGVERNAQWLRDIHGDRFELCVGDVRNANAVAAALIDASAVFHLAAQGAVTQSLEDPRDDFSVNALGTMNVLEALRRNPGNAPLVFTSTSQVYGRLGHVPIDEGPLRYQPSDPGLAATGFSETQPLEFCSPCGCSKGCADQYVLDYAKTFGLRTVVMRMSCIYGPRQFGSEDQGWVAHFVKRSLAGQAIMIYGSGKQVRDLLFVDDAIDALLLARKRIDELSGRAFNLGGGPDLAVSLLELLRLLEDVLGQKAEVGFSPERLADQRYYVSDTRKFSDATGWSARTSLRQGLRQLYQWLSVPAERRPPLFAPAETRA